MRPDDDEDFKEEEKKEEDKEGEGSQGGGDAIEVNDIELKKKGNENT